MILFFDTSALIKLYVDEPGSETIKKSTQQAIVAVSQLTFAETHATFTRLLREQRIDLEEHQQLCDQFEQDWSTLILLKLTAATLKLVPSLCIRHPLRGADSLQLASAVLMHQEGVTVTFATSDNRLFDAALSEGIAALDPADQ